MSAELERQDRIEAFSLAGACLFASVVCFFMLFSLWSDNTGRPIELSGRINPNTAPVESLMRLSGIGQARARAIVEYRSGYSEANGQAFESAGDLEKVHGIGPAIAGRLEQWVEFGTEPAENDIVVD